MRKKVFSKTSLKYLVGILVPLLILYLLFSYVIGIYTIPSASMQTTIMKGDTAFISKIAYLNKKPAYGDIIVIKGKDTPLIKRVIGLPGDTISFSNGKVFRNNIEIVENYTVGNTWTKNSEDTQFEIPQNCVFVLGDNRENSKDSRFWEYPYVSFDRIIGRAYLAYGFNNFHFQFL